MTTRVIFCRLEGKGVIAVFPDIKYSGYHLADKLVQSYEIVGQHGCFFLGFFDRRTVSSRCCEILTNPADYQDTLDELVSIGYNDIKVITKYKRNRKLEGLG